MLAANAPRALARKAASEGIGVVLGDPHVARETNAPEDDYWEAFREAMKDHPGTTPATLQRQYAAQCLKDDTMAESITDHLAERAEAGDRPLVVLVCGSFHAEHGRGTVARIRSRMPDLDVRVLTAETVDDLSRGIYQSPRGVGDYVVVVERAPGGAEPPADAPAPVAAVPEPAPAATAPTPVTARAPADVGDAAGGRPGLGLRPAYDTGTEGVLVDAVSPGGGAEAAGIEPGDVLVELAGTKIEDVRHYAELLAEQTIGKTIPVRVRRDGAEVVLRVRVGVSAR